MPIIEVDAMSSGRHASSAGVVVEESGASSAPTLPADLNIQTFESFPSQQQAQQMIHPGTKNSLKDLAMFKSMSAY